MMMQLKHPEFGICAQEMIGYKTIGSITYQWCMKYGNKFYECDLIITSYCGDEASFSRPIANSTNPPYNS